MDFRTDKKGRRPYRLSFMEVADIRCSSLTGKELAKLYGVSQSYISLIRTYKVRVNG